MIVGAKDAEHVKDAMMWTILGFPLTSIALPTWLSAGELPKALAMDKDLKSPICTAALKFKADCFPIQIDHGTNYINLSAVINKEGSGYMQLTHPIEKEVFRKANLLINEMESGKKTTKDIQAFYQWLDQYLSKTYKEQFNYNLFND